MIIIKEELHIQIFNWAKVLWVIKYLNDLNSKLYFSLEKFCKENNLDYIKISNFLESANSIIGGESELIKAFEKEKDVLDKLNNLDVNVLKTI